VSRGGAVLRGVVGAEELAAGRAQVWVRGLQLALRPM
jgi:hypothetical protein